MSLAPSHQNELCIVDSKIIIKIKISGTSNNIYPLGEKMYPRVSRTIFNVTAHACNLSDTFFLQEHIDAKFYVDNFRICRFKSVLCILP